MNCTCTTESNSTASIKKLRDLLNLVELLADGLPPYDDPEEYIVSFRSLGEHDGELLLSKIRRLATRCLFTQDTCDWLNITELSNHGYKVGVIEYENCEKNTWNIGAIYTKYGAIYYNAP